MLKSLQHRYKQSFDRRFFPSLRQSLTDTGIKIETPLPTAGPVPPQSPLPQSPLPTSPQPLAASTFIQFDGDIVTFVRPGLDGQTIADHWTYVRRALAKLSGELSLLDRCGRYIQRTVIGGRVCFGIGAASGGAEVLTSYAILTETLAAVSGWPMILAIGGLAVSAVTESSTRYLRWRVNRFIARHGIAF